MKPYSFLLRPGEIHSFTFYFLQNTFLNNVAPHFPNFYNGESCEDQMGGLAPRKVPPFDP